MTKATWSSQKRKKKHLTNSIEGKDKVLNNLERKRTFLVNIKTIWKTNKQKTRANVILANEYFPREQGGPLSHQLY